MAACHLNDVPVGGAVSSPDATLLEVEGLVTRYPVPRGVVGTLMRRPKLQVHAVEGVDFSVAAGEMLALVGESGCGKTTTAQTVMRMVDADSGSIRFRGQELAGMSNRQLRPLRREMQIIYQDPYESLDPRFRVRDTVEEPLQIHGIGVGSGADREGRVREALVQAGLQPPELYLDRYPHELSGGQRQRVAIAAAMVLKPKLLLADEPVSMLDVSVRAGILRLLDDLRRDGLAIVMITHDLSTAAHFADRIAVMYLGRIVEEGPAKDVVRNPQHPYTKALISVVPKRDPRDSTASPDPDRRDPEPGVHPVRLPVPPALPDRRGHAAASPTRSCAARPARRRRTTARPAFWHDAAGATSAARWASFRPVPATRSPTCPGVLVGHSQAASGEATGVTVIVPPRLPTHAGVETVNGVGELTKKLEIDEWGVIQTPVWLCGTHAVGHGLPRRDAGRRRRPRPHGHPGRRRVRRLRHGRRAHGHRRRRQCRARKRRARRSPRAASAAAPA